MNLLHQLDDTDLQIISILSKDAKTPYSEIGKQLFVSGGTVHVRIKKMIEYGVITGSQIKINHALLGYDVIAFIGIYLEKSQLYDNVSAAIKKIPEIVESHYTTGGYSIFAKIICMDTADLKDILAGKLQSIPGIARTETFISLDESINRPPEFYAEGED